MTIMAKLKEATREQHERLESVVDVMGGGLSPEAYKALVAKFHSFYAGIEPKIAACDMEAVGFNFEERRKLPLLERDLRNLGAATRNIWDDLPVIDSHAKAFGALYVLEGATLGGQVIARHLRYQLGIDADSGCAFFASYGERVGPMWKAFGAAVNEFSESQGDDEEMIATARETFESFAKCFTAESDVVGTALAV